MENDMRASGYIARNDPEAMERNIEQDSKPANASMKVYRGDFLLHTAYYYSSTLEKAREDARHYFEWDGVDMVKLFYWPPVGEQLPHIEEISKAA